jgi:hypothetical protein
MATKRLLFISDELGELYLEFKDVRLPDTIQDKLATFDSPIAVIHDPRYTLTNQPETFDLGKPLLFEWQPIAVHFIPATPTQDEYEFQINGQTVLHSRIVARQSQIVGEINLKNSVGLSRFSILCNGQEIFFWENQIFPQKLDYQDDYSSMMLDISQTVYNLAYDYLNKTYTQARPNEYINPSNVEWLALIKTLFDPFCQSIDHLLRQPHSVIRKADRIRPVDRIQRTNKKAGQWLAKNPKYLHTDPTHGIGLLENLATSHLVEQRKHISYDTYENRFVLWAINQLIVTLDELTRFLSELLLNDSVREQETNFLKILRQRLLPYLRSDLFREVGKFENRFDFSTVLTMGPGYKDFYHRFRLLQKGLTIRDQSLFRLDLKDISILYEYWCFLKIVSILKNERNYVLVSSNLVKVEHNRLTVNLRKGKTSKVSFRNTSTNDLIAITFNRSFTKLPTYPQQPDILLEITKAGSNTTKTYILDAKYRFERKTGNVAEADKYGPPQDAIGQLHRYRDAIVVEKNGVFKRRVLGGLILFPYPEDEEHFRLHTFYKSYAKVRIGAVPFQPGSNRLNKLFREFLTFNENWQ